MKFMSLVLPDGYVLDMIGPFQGTSNDADITRKITEMKTSLVDWCKMDDTMVVDRGFRDVIDTFEQLGYEAHKPSYLRKNQTQHTTEEANKATLVTKVRWTVESHHARIKKFLFF